VRICVPIKQVPETGAVRMDEATGTMIREGIEAIVNPLDLYSIELAIRLREGQAADQAGSPAFAPDARRPGPSRLGQGESLCSDQPPGRQGEGEIVTISMGPPKADKAIREAIAMGCDRGVLISDPAFAGSDTWATSYVLAAAIRKLGPFDLVICGERATDGDTGQVGPGIAACLDLPVVTYVSKVRRLDRQSLVVERLVEDGHEVLEMQLPGVLTVVKEIGDPRLPTLRGKQRARRAEVPRWGPGDLEVRPDRIGLAGSPTRVVKIYRPSLARQCERLVVSDEASLTRALDRVVEVLKDRNLI
jgi:electron transfer flavoprotein beta subunit